MSKAFGKRLGFKRTNTNQEPVTVTELSDFDTHGEASGTSPGDDFDGVPREISEVEANHKLKTFKQDHKWDPNMPDDAFDKVDAVTAIHDAKGEAEVVGEVIENSPYPEVCICNLSAVFPYLYPVTDHPLGPRCRTKLR